MPWPCLWYYRLVEEMLIGVLTVSDRASSGEYEDRGGPAAEQYLEAAFTSPVRIIRMIVPDEIEDIKAALCQLCDSQGCHLVLTTGGTGPTSRDCTPEATMQVCQKELPGMSERMRHVSVEIVPTAMLSRQIAAIRHESLILNLPGNPKAISECLDAVLPAIPHCIKLIGGPKAEIKNGPLIPH